MYITALNCSALIFELKFEARRRDGHAIDLKLSNALLKLLIISQTSKNSQQISSKSEPADELKVDESWRSNRGESWNSYSRLSKA